MKTFISMISAIALATAIGCSKQEEGAAEKAGKQVDEAIEKVESYTSEKMHEAGEAVEEAGQEMQK
jgi:hypothetical protein